MNKINGLRTRALTAALAAVLGGGWIAVASAQATTDAAADRAAATQRGHASDSSRSGTERAQRGETRVMRDARASKLIGTDVKNAQGETLGEIKDLVIDTRSGRVRYAVLAHGGVLGVGEKWFAYPVQAFRAAADRDELVLNVDKDRLKDAPGFTRETSPNWGEYGSRVDRFFARLGIGDHDGDRSERHADAKRPATRHDLASNANLRRASELIGRNVSGDDDRNAGEIEDLVVSMADGRVRYVVMDFDKAWSPDDKLLALPLTAFRFGGSAAGGERDRDTVRLTVPRERLDMARGFDEDRWPDLNDARWRSDNDRHLSSMPAAGASAAGTAAGAMAGAAREGARDAADTARRAREEARQAGRQAERAQERAEDAARENRR